MDVPAVFAELILATKSIAGLSVTPWVVAVELGGLVLALHMSIKVSFTAASGIATREKADETCFRSCSGSDGILMRG